MTSIALRTYLGVFLYPRAAGATVAQAFSQTLVRGRGSAVRTAGGPASEPQGEALGFTRDGRGYVTRERRRARHRCTASSRPEPAARVAATGGAGTKRPP